MSIEVGMKNVWEITVTDDMCADCVNEQLPQIDLPHVFSTPSMLGLMELTCADLLARNIEEGKGSVGMAVNIRHVAATESGKKVRCEVEVAEVKGRKILFNVKAFDEKGLIGEGQHRRAIIDK